MTDKPSQYYYSRGRRKEAIATARLYAGKGEVVANDRPVAEYFNNQSLVEVATAPLKRTGQEQKLRVSLHLSGGGKRGQADAARLAIARALTVMSEELRPTLKKAAMLTRDPREKERKKYGLKRARKAPQFSKR